MLKDIYELLRKYENKTVEEEAFVFLYNDLQELYNKYELQELTTIF